MDEFGIEVKDIWVFVQGFKFFAWVKGNKEDRFKVRLPFEMGKGKDQMEIMRKKLLELYDQKKLDYRKVSRSIIQLVDIDSLKGSSNEISKFSLKNPEFSLKNSENDLNFSPLNPNFFFRVLDGQNLEDFYEDLNLISQGADFKLFQGTQKSSGLKRFIKEYCFSPTDLKTNEKYFKEVEIMKKFDHLNIVHIFEVIKKNDLFFIIFEYCEGGSLLEKMIKVSKITEKDAVKVMKDLTSAVKVLHDEGILNGSLKISSFWYDLNSECLKLVDFSKSIIIRDQNPIKLNFLSNYYTAPESINGQISLKVDIWSLGVIFYILLAGRPPFYSKSQELLFHKILTQDLDFPNDFSPDVKDLLKKMLSKDPETRFSITQVIEHDCFKSQVLESSEIPDFQPLENIHLIDPQAKDLNCFFYFVANHLINPVHHEKAKKIFKLLDADHDGVLTVRDLELSCEKFQLQINVKTFFEKVDLSQDQKVSFSDFLFGVIDKEMIKTPEILLNAFNSLKILESRIFSPLVKNFNGLIKSDPFRSSCLLGENSEVSRFLTISEFLRLFS